MQATASQAPPFSPSDAFSHPLVEVTQSSIGTFNECRQKFVFRYMMRLAPPGTAQALLIGTAVHSALEYLLAPSTRKVKPKPVAIEVDKIINGYFDQYVTTIDIAQATTMDKVERSRSQALAIMDAWQVVHTDWPERFKVLHTEFNVRSSATSTISPMLERVAGKIDGLVLTADTGQLFLLEHKTRFTLSDFNFVSGLDLDQQCLFYAMLYQAWMQKNPELLSQLGAKKHALKLPSGFFYDGIAKPQHRGDPHSIRQRMATAMMSDPSKYFCFIPIEMDSATIEWARQNFERTIAQMDALRPGNVTTNLKACNAYGGCPYQTLCRAHADANDPASVMRLPEARMYQVKSLHSELDDPEETEEIFG